MNTNNLIYTDHFRWEKEPSKTPNNNKKILAFKN